MQPAEQPFAFAEDREGAVNPLLQRERDCGTIATTPLTHLLYGGAEQHARMTQIQAMIAADPVFNTADRPFLNHSERYLRSAQKMARFHSIINDLNFGPQETRWAYAAIDEVLPTDVHMAMVLPTLEYQTSPEQRARWLPLARSFNILGEDQGRVS